MTGTLCTWLLFPKQCKMVIYTAAGCPYKLAIYKSTFCIAKSAINTAAVCVCGGGGGIKIDRLHDSRLHCQFG